MIDIDDIEKDLRQHQEAAEGIGLFYGRLYKLAERIIEEFYTDVPGMPTPLISLDTDGGRRRGYYVPVDGSQLLNRISLNLDVLRDGAEAAETLAHEMVHLFENHIGQPCENEYHGEAFHARMSVYGIQTIGSRGRHVGYVDDRWQRFMETNADLELEKFILPGADRTPPRRQLKHECPGCGSSFRSRREDPFTSCLDCDVPFVVTD